MTRLNDPLACWPVGSIYMSVSSTSPATLFGGAWERLTGRFLLAATDGGSSGASQAAGRTGGAASASHTPAGTVGGHKLTVSEMPSHNHGSRSLTGTFDMADNVVRNGATHPAIGAASGIMSRSQISHNKCYVSTSVGGGSAYDRVTVNATHTHDSQGGGGSHSHGFTGTAATIATMPPYLAVYVWKRTA